MGMPISVHPVAETMFDGLPAAAGGYYSVSGAGGCNVPMVAYLDTARAAAAARGQLTNRERVARNDPGVGRHPMAWMAERDFIVSTSPCRPQKETTTAATCNRGDEPKP